MTPARRPGRLRESIAEVFGHPAELIVLAPGGLRKGNRYVVRVRKDGESLARQTGLVDSHGRPGPRPAPAGGRRAPPATARPPGAVRSWPTAR